MANFSHIRYNANTNTSQDNHTPFFPYFDFHDFTDPEIRFNKGYVFDYVSQDQYGKIIEFSVDGCQKDGKLCKASDGPFYVELQISENNGIRGARIVTKAQKYEAQEDEENSSNLFFIEICTIKADGTAPPYIYDLKLRENIHFYGTGAGVEVEGDPCYLNVTKDENTFSFDIKIPDPPQDKNSVLVSYGGCSGFQWIEAPSYDESASSIYLFGYDASTEEFKFFNTFECPSGQ